MTWNTPIAIRPLAFSPDGKLLAAESAKRRHALGRENGQSSRRNSAQPNRRQPCASSISPSPPAACRWRSAAWIPSGAALSKSGISVPRLVAATQPVRRPPSRKLPSTKLPRPAAHAPSRSEARAKPLVLVGHSDWVTGVAFSPDGKRVASSSRDETVKVWDSVTGQEQFTARRSGQNILDGHRGYVESVAFSPDGKYLASVGDDHAVYLWSASTGRCACGWLTHKSIVMAVAYSPDGSRLATASSDNTVKVWDANPEGHRGGEILSLDHGMPLSVAFSPDNKRLASAGRDNNIRVWNPATAELELTITHTDQITSVVFSPDGSRLASAGPTGVQLWDARTGKFLVAAAGRHRNERACDISPERQVVVYFGPGSRGAIVGCGDMPGTPLAPRPRELDWRNGIQS